MLFVFSLLFVSVNAFDSEIHAKYLSLPRAEFVEYFNSLNLTWKIKQQDVERRHHHCSFIDYKKTYPILRHDVSALNLPINFDARQEWSQCTSIGTIYDQELCGSCWAFGAATTASDRNCIHAKFNISLSEQDLSCCKECYVLNPCDGGDPSQAFQFWINRGLVTSACMPYDMMSLNNKTACTKTCVNGEDYNNVKNYGGKVFSISPEEDQIKAELYKNGPIEATMHVYEDLELYTKGVYVHMYGKARGLHSIRIIGYGVENGLNYWLLANSWGTKHGEKGFYKVKSFQPQLHLEEQILAPKPQGF